MIQQFREKRRKDVYSTERATVVEFIGSDMKNFWIYYTIWQFHHVQRWTCRVDKIGQVKSVHEIQAYLVLQVGKPEWNLSVPRGVHIEWLSL